MESMRGEIAACPPVEGAYTPRRGDFCIAKFVDGEWYAWVTQRPFSPAILLGQADWHQAPPSTLEASGPLQDPCPPGRPVPPVFQPAARGRGRAWAFRGGTYVWAEGEASPWGQGAAGRGAGEEGREVGGPRAREAEVGLAGEVQLGSEALPCSCPAVTSSSPPPRYRARVEKVESLAKVHVFYIDYGNVSWEGLGGGRVFPPTPDNGQEAAAAAPSTRSSCPGQRRLGGRRNRGRGADGAEGPGLEIAGGDRGGLLASCGRWRQAWERRLRVSGSLSLRLGVPHLTGWF